MDSFFMTNKGKSNAAAEMELIRRIHDGELNETRKHGKVIVKKTAGLIVSVSEVGLADGSRTKLLERGVPEQDDWRVQNEDGRWVYGKLDFAKSDVNFIPHEEQPVPTVYAPSNLPAHLIKSEEACDFVQDENMAVILYGALASGSWVMTGTGRNWNCNWMQAADIVAQMRGRNEPASHLLFTYESEREGFEEEDVIVELMASIGWEFGGEPDMELSHKRAYNLVAEHETHEAGSAPDWYGRYITTALRPYDTTILARLHRAAFTGRIPFQQWCKFWQYYDHNNRD